VCWSGQVGDGCWGVFEVGRGGRKGAPALRGRRGTGAAARAGGGVGRGGTGGTGAPTRGHPGGGVAPTPWMAPDSLPLPQPEAHHRPVAQRGLGAGGADCVRGAAGVQCHGAVLLAGDTAESVAPACASLPAYARPHAPALPICSCWRCSRAALPTCAPRPTGAPCAPSSSSPRVSGAESWVGLHTTLPPCLWPPPAPLAHQPRHMPRPTCSAPRGSAAGVRVLGGGGAQRRRRRGGAVGRGVHASAGDVPAVPGAVQAGGC
jgi:hypothetical protein